MDIGQEGRGIELGADDRCTNADDDNTVHTLASVAALVGTNGPRGNGFERI